MLTDTNNGLDMVLVAGREGIVLLWFDESQRAWRSNVVGPGSVQDRTYWGSGSVDVARVRDDDVGYIPACEVGPIPLSSRGQANAKQHSVQAYHGNTVSVYIKEANAPKGAASLKDRTNWKRIVVDDFGQLDPQQRTGTIHHVASVKIDNSDVDSFVIACVGARESPLLYELTKYLNYIFSFVSALGKRELFFIVGCGFLTMRALTAGLSRESGCVHVHPDRSFARSVQEDQALGRIGWSHCDR